MDAQESCRTSHGQLEFVICLFLIVKEKNRNMSVDFRYQVQQLQKLPENKNCVDCNAPNPQWASVSFGTFFCLGATPTTHTTTNTRRMQWPTQVARRAHILRAISDNGLLERGPDAENEVWREREMQAVLPRVPHRRHAHQTKVLHASCISV